MTTGIRVEQTGKDFLHVWKQRPGKSFLHRKRWRPHASLHEGLASASALWSQLVLVQLVVDATRGDPEEAGHVRLIALGFMQSHFAQ